MIEMKATTGGGKIRIQSEIHGTGEEVLEEGLAVIASIIDFYANKIDESKEDVLKAIFTLLLNWYESVSDGKMRS